MKGQHVAIVVHLQAATEGELEARKKAYAALTEQLDGVCIEEIYFDDQYSDYYDKEANDLMGDTLWAYKKMHEAEEGEHRVTVYANFTECACGDHAHYAKYGEMIQHSRAPESYKTVKVEVA